MKMQALLSILWILMPMLLGFAFKINQPCILKLIDWVLIFSLYAILFITGVSITKINDLGQQITNIIWYGVVFLSLTLLLNILFMYFYDKKTQRKNLQIERVTYIGRLQVIYSSFRQIFWVLLGGAIGFLFPGAIQDSNSLVSIFLMIMLLLIGIQLRSSGIQLQDVLLNRKGIHICILFTISCWIAAIAASFILEIQFFKAIALNSGFGWYSLSSVFFNKVYGPFWGAVALLNDLGREMMAFILIPAVIQFSPSSGIAISGATSIDFTLPAIKKAGGMGLVPVAISFGLMTSFLCPFFITFFSQL